MINTKEIIIEIILKINFFKIKSDKKSNINIIEHITQYIAIYFVGNIFIFNKINKIAKKEKTKETLTIKFKSFIILSFINIILSFIKFVSH